MTRIRSGDGSRIQDRRGQSGGGGGMSFPGLGRSGGGMGMPIKGGGGLIGLLVIAAIVFLPRLFGGDDTNNLFDYADGTTDQAVQGDPCDDELESIICGANEDVQDYWTRVFPATYGEDYPDTQLVYFSGGTQTGCGSASAEMGPFYCPADNLVYFDLDFLPKLQRQVGAEGDLAAQYIVAHEFGHHVQNVTGQNQPPADFRGTQNQWSVLVELQADCLAGAWAGDAAQRTDEHGLPLLEPGEISEAINAAAAVGDDAIQRQSGSGRVNPDTFTHGTSEQRVAAFTEGFQTRDPNACDPRAWTS